VQLAKAHIDQAKASGKPISALLINTGNANAGTGEAGLANAQATCDALGKLMGVDASQVLPFSTGVILEPLPLERLVAGLPAARDDLRADQWSVAAEAIMTTDTMPKAASRRVRNTGAVPVFGLTALKSAGLSAKQRWGSSRSSARCSS
jgi:glutamate N-acetyltransferase/amino-acid N-acetyltransferase